MSLTINSCLLLLKEHHLLKSSAIQGDLDTVMCDIAFDSRVVKKDSIFFCKGDHFRPAFLTMAKDKGAITYVAEKPMVEGTGLNAFIVRNVTKAMAILAAAFYDYPQDDLNVLAITGTKGKTTTAYFAQSILDKQIPHRVALFSTIERIMGSNPGDTIPSNLSTPESVDLFSEMSQAGINDMMDLVMEVSSQAYLRNRVFGLTYDVGVFLNISPDHVGENEHPSYANYLHNKIQLIMNSRKVVLNADTQDWDMVSKAAEVSTDDDSIFVYAGKDYLEKHPEIDFDFYYEINEDLINGVKFVLHANSQKGKLLNIDGDYEISMPGIFNVINAVGAIISSTLLGANRHEAFLGIKDVRVPGRLEVLDLKEHGTVVVDFAHNKLSLTATLNFIKSKFPNAKISVVTGSAGDKGINRRSDMGEVLNDLADRVYLTTDDPDFEEASDIAEEMRSYITNDQVEVSYVEDREEAIKKAVLNNGPEDVVLLAGKGADKYMIVRGQKLPYAGDKEIALATIKD
ncbi:UDP-N-acetylmuramyl-tripeptide synthetase [Xylocopilactobacillus apis]|uniref:UDP-N-acetylmuramyl-tripeptide synthetase n=1 Tax=Xylocopilactobacillus apis TaxID=2932183 RepID=A0AAU9D0H7_9LACO|nr:UDP-N-acetylmuramyl-tripeptide synthetase [Xylocopilactobacillus apis]BDR56021.1 UDP-N-acetylmuramyl-tripeptide synthetase [Xylocopilactobacillus apis]